MGGEGAVLIVNKPGSNVVLELATITAVSKGKRRGRVDGEQIVPITCQEYYLFLGHTHQSGEKEDCSKVE